MDSEERKLIINCLRGDKALWVKAANSPPDRKKLEQWVNETLNKAAREQLGIEGQK